MNECILNKKGINKIQSGFAGIRMSMKTKGISTIQVNLLINSLIDSYKNYKDPSVQINTEEDQKSFDESVLAALETAAKRFGFLGNPEFILNEIKLREKFFSQPGQSELIPTGNQTTDQLRSIKEVPYEKDSKGEFLLTSYGRASRVREKAEQQMKVSFVNSILIDRRDNINESRVINNDSLLNQKIRNFKQRLFDTIITSLSRFELEAGGIGNEMHKYKDAKLFILNDNGTFTYTGLIELIEKDPAFSMFRPENFGDNGADTLIALDLDLNRKYLLDGYNAYQFLKHFDEYFYMKYGKIVSFDSFGKRSGGDVYHFITKGTNNSTTWRDSDDIDITKECPLAVQEIINTTKLYEFDHNELKVINGDLAYLKFSDLSHIIGIIKNLVFNIPDINWNESIGLGKTRLDVLGVSDETKITAKGLTLHQLINRIRVNPLKYLAAIFDILGTPSSFNELLPGSKLAETFTKEDKDLIYTLNKEIFNPNGNSINSISKEDPINNYYAWITLVCDSISQINFLLYYRDNKGIIKVRNMTDTRLDSLQRSVRQVIRTLNSKKANGDFTAFLKNFEGGLLKFEKTTSGIEFIKKFGDNYIKFQVNNDGKVTHTLMATTNGGKELIKSKNQLLNYKNTPPGLLEFLSGIIGLEITPGFIDILKDISNNQIDQILNDLINLASRTIFLRYLSQEVVKGINSYDEVKDKLKKILGTEVKYDKSLGEIDTIHDSDTNTIEHLAKAIAYQQGLFSSNLVKSGNGNALSLYALSRLLGNLTSLIEVLCRLQNAALNEAFLIKNPNVFKGIYTAREFYSTDQVQDHTNFTSSEFVYSEIVCDFLGGLNSEKTIGNNLVGNGIVALLPSVNSDKNTIGRLLIDTNQRINIEREDYIEGIRNNIAIKDLNEQEWLLFIAHDLGKCYKKTYGNITKDFEKLLTWDGYIDPRDSLNRISFKNLYTPDLYVTNFSNLNQYITNTYPTIFKQSPTPIAFIKDLCDQYNKAHRTNPIHLIDQIHFQGKKNLEANLTLLSYLYRFKSGPFDHILDPEGLVSQKIAFYNSDWTINNSAGYVTNEQFWKIKETEIFKSLINSNFLLDTLDNTQSSIEYLTKTSGGYYKSVDECTKWIDYTPGSANGKTGLLILGYLDGKKIISKDDLNGLDLTDSKILLLHKFELNPLFKLYNYMDYLFTLEFMLSTVGSCIAHPGKMKGTLGLDYTVLEEEAARFQALHKRNVSFTAAMQEFLLNLLNGIPSQYNIAIIDDIKDIQYNVSGNIDEIKPYDGATFVNPFVTYLENNSLNGAKAGISKKQFVHYYDAKTGTGGIIKTAGFGLTNDWIRNSKMLQRMMYKMTKGTWLNEDGSEFKTDITKNFKGLAIKYGDIYYKRNGKYYKVIPLEIKAIVDSNGNLTNLYEVLERELTVQKINGQLGSQSFKELAVTPKPRTITINSNYTLWLAFGGFNSLEVSGTSLVPSEKSITQVVEAMNQIGIVKNSNIRTLEDVYQPLKHSDIHYCPTIGAVKQGAANINGASSYYDDKDYTFMKINLNQIGILLDKEHHADGEELSLMTLVISACAHKGYTGDIANKIYEALHTLTEIGTLDILTPVKLYFQVFTDKNASDEDKAKANDSIKEAVINTVISLMSKETLDEQSLLHTLAGELLKKAREGQHLSLQEDIKGNLPIDNPQIYRQFLSKLSVFLTNSGIKAKIPGLLAVLTPSHQLMKVHTTYYADENGELLESALKPEAILNLIGADGNEISEEDYLELLLQSVPKVLSENGDINMHNLKQNRTYVINYNLPEFQYGTFTDGRLASTNPITKIITYRENPVSVEEFFNYITGQDSSPTGSLKAEVFKKLQEKGYSLEYLLKLILTPEDVQAVVLWHEQAHKDNPPTNYWDYEKANNIIINSTNPLYDASRINWLAKEKILEELRATLIGLQKLEYNKNLKLYTVRTPKDRKKLRKLIQSRRINSCQEWIKDGRDLGEYDILFFDINNNQYSLYDLDSVQALFELRDILDIKDSAQKINAITKFNQKYSTLLQENVVDVKLIESKLRSLVRKDTSMLSKEGGKFFKDYNQGIVYIDGLAIQVNRNQRINIIPYEIITPKANATKFNLRKYDSINDILTNQDFFFDRLLENFSTRVNKEHCFDIELKRSTNNALIDDIKRNHIYLLNKENLSGKGPASRPEIAGELQKIEVLTEIIDGKRYRVDTNGNPLYELKSGDEIYQEIATGTEIIVSDNLLFYLERLKYTIPRISDYYYMTKPDKFSYYEELINKSGKVNKAAKKWSNFIFNNSLLRDENGQYIKDENGKLQINTELFHKQELNSLLYGDLKGNYLDNPNAPQFLYLHNLGREMYSSFVQSLECVASRTPSQSMQSFMPMRIVAFDNPDVNTAYVSTAQIWLLGSDFDIDAVSIAMYDIGEDGKLVTWSSMSDLSTVRSLKDSLNIPFPTGKIVLILEGNDSESYNSNKELIDLFIGLDDSKLFKLYITSDGIKLVQNKNKVLEVIKFINLLNLQGIVLLTDYAKQELSDKTNFTEELIELILLELMNKINEHNFYLNHTTASENASAANNYSLYNIYQTTQDPSNLIQSQSSVDAMTGPAKKKGNESASAGDVKTRTPGSFVNKVESINDNQVGKMGISICAVGMKTFFGLTGYANKVLNDPNATQKDKNRLLINNREGITIGGQTYYHLADINPKLTEELLEKWIDKLLKAKSEEDAALVLSAMLSLATD